MISGKSVLKCSKTGKIPSTIERVMERHTLALLYGCFLPFQLISFLFISISWCVFISFLKLTLTQVQLLVSNSDVENYKQIKSDLDELRLLVEKSELWVYKSKKDLPTETRVRKITPGLVGLRKPDGGSSKESESPRKDSLEQEGVAVSTSQDPQSSDSESGSTKVGHARSVSKVPLVTVLAVTETFG